MMMLNNESIEFDIIVNGEKAKESIEDVEKAQNELAGTVKKTSDSIKTDWRSIGLAATAAAVTIGALIKKSTDLERAMFGLNDETKRWIEYASSQYALDQVTIANFVQMGKAASLTGDTIGKMVEQGVAMSRQFSNLNVDSAVEDLTEFYSTGTASGAVLEYLEKVTGDAEIQTRSFTENLKALEENTAGVNAEFAKTKAAKMDQFLIDLDNAAIDVGASFSDLASESGLLGNAVWVAKKAMDGLSLAFNGWQQLYYSGMKLVGSDSEKYQKKLDELAKNATDIRKRLGGSDSEEVTLPEIKVTGGYSSPRIRTSGRSSGGGGASKVAREEDREREIAKRANERFWEDYKKSIMSATEYQLDQLNKRYTDYRDHVEDKAALEEWLIKEQQEILKQGDENMRQWAETQSRLFDSLGGALADFATGGKASFKDMATSIINDLLRMQIKMQTVSLLTSMFGGGNGTQSPISFFAKGGVINSPTIFPMAKGVGVAGEAGAEAIMPIKRSKSGDLGVSADVAPAIINVINNSTSDVDVKQQGNEIDIIISKITNDIQRGSGNLPKAFEARYGLTKK